MRYALIEGGIVANVIGVESAQVDRYLASLPGGVTAVALTDADRCGPGWAYSGSAFARPASVISRAAIRQAIRDERHRRALLGVQIMPSGRWIASDAMARARWAAMDILGAALPEDQEDETLDGVAFVVSPAFATKVPLAYAALDKALHLRAKALIAAVTSEANPEDVDIMAGWPVTFA